MATAGPAQRETEAVAGNPQALMSVRGLGIRFKTSQGVWQATRKIDFDIAPGELIGRRDIGPGGWGCGLANSARDGTRQHAERDS